MWSPSHIVSVDTVTVGKGLTEMETVAVFLQLLTSVTVTVKLPGFNPVTVEVVWLFDQR